MGPLSPITPTLRPNTADSSLSHLTNTLSPIQEETSIQLDESILNVDYKVALPNVIETPQPDRHHPERSESINYINKNLSVLMLDDISSPANNNDNLPVEAELQSDIANNNINSLDMLLPPNVNNSTDRSYISNEPYVGSTSNSVEDVY